jgi:hypothetical protein
MRNTLMTCRGLTFIEIILITVIIVILVVMAMPMFTEYRERGDAPIHNLNYRFFNPTFDVSDLTIESDIDRSLLKRIIVNSASTGSYPNDKIYHLANDLRNARKIVIYASPDSHNNLMAVAIYRENKYLIALDSNEIRNFYIYTSIAGR